MQDFKKTPFEMDTRRVTLEEVEEVRAAALENQNQALLAWSYLMREILSIRQLLEQQDNPRDGGDGRRNCTNDSSNH